MTQAAFIDGLQAEIRQDLVTLRQAYANLPEAELKRRNGLGEWTALECFAHLNAYYEYYLPAAELALHKARARRWYPQGEVRYTARGRRLLRRSAPDGSKKYKSAKAFNFKEKPIGPEAVKTLIIHCERFLRLLEAAKEIDLNKPKVRKTGAWKAQYTLGNLFEWMATHTRKHLLQVGRALGK